VLDEYVQDSQCGTWEIPGEAVHPGGMSALGHLGKRGPKVLEQKKNWAKKICEHMNVEVNLSPSFQCFRDGLRHLIEE